MSDRERVLVDCVGLYCPLPVMRAREEIDQLAPGELLELLADDPASAEDIPRWARRTGHLVLDWWKEGAVLHFLIRKGEENLNTKEDLRDEQT